MKKLILSLLIMFIGLTNVYATHNRGGDITYKYVGDISHPYRYRVTVKTYTQWVGSVSTDRCELIFKFGDGDTALVPRVNGPSVNCPSAHDGVMVLSDIRQNIYETDHDFPGNGYYFISVEDQNRNSGICNIASSGDQSFYLQAELIINPFLGNNNGPIYTKIPIISDSIGIIQYYNPMVTEADGDAMYFDLVPAMGFGMDIPSYTYPAASTSFSIDHSFGIIKWDTPMLICEYTFDIRITEWREIGGTFYYMGSTMQDGWNRPNNLSSGISESKNETISIDVFPNPATDLVNFCVADNPENKNYSVQISNSLGQMIKEIEFTKTAILTELKSGMYFYSIHSSGKTVKQGKFIVLGASVK